jgi:hypothetical protein
MPHYERYGVEKVEKDGILKLSTGSITVSRQGKKIKVLNAETAETTYVVEKGDEISRSTDVDYEISAHK